MAGGPVDCIVDDVAAIIARLPMTLRAKHYTTDKVAGEVLDSESRSSLEFMVEAGLIEVVEDPETSLDLATPGSRRLSEADKSLLRLAASLRGKCKSIAIATDDYSLQEAAARLGFKVITVRYRGARSVRGGRLLP